MYQIIILLCIIISFESYANNQENEFHQDLKISEINPIKKTQLSLKGNFNTNLNFPNTNGISGVSFEYSKIYSNKLLLGFVLRNNSGSLGYSEGGNLDEGRYYKDSWGLQGNSIGILSSYFYNLKGILGGFSPFIKGTLEYFDGRKKYKSETYGREKNIASILIRDKSLIDSESSESKHNALISNLAFGIQLNNLYNLNNSNQNYQFGIIFAINSLFDFSKSENPLLVNGRQKNFESYLGSQLELGLSVQF